MRISLIIISIVFIALQTATTIAWLETEIIEEFTDIFLGLYRSGIPIWSDIAFSFGAWWLLSSFTSLVLWVYGSFFEKSNKLVFLALIISGLSFVGMIYAMYPVHIMLTDMKF